jgi:RNA polymerase sigma-70 factor (ECF subfamily)
MAIARNRFLKETHRRSIESPAGTALELDVAGATTDEDQFDWERLQQAIDQLSEKFRVVLLMFYFEDAGYREIADQLQLPIGTVMSRLARAKQSVRRYLMRAEGPPRPKMIETRRAPSPTGTGGPMIR